LKYQPDMFEVLTQLNQFLSRTLGMEGYAGIEVRLTSMGTEIRVRCAKAADLVNKKARTLKEIKALVEKRYNFNNEDNKLDLSIKPLNYDRNLCAAANAEVLKHKLMTGTPVRLAANNILGTVMRRGGAIGCQVLVSGKIRGQRAKAMKYVQGYQISTGQPKHDFIDIAVRSCELRQGVIGIKVLIMQGLEIGQGADRKVLPDLVQIYEPKEEDDNIVPTVITTQSEEPATQQ
jgi:small subunit ribosomal protein S3e